MNMVKKVKAELEEIERIRQEDEEAEEERKKIKEKAEAAKLRIEQKKRKEREAEVRREEKEADAKQRRKYMEARQRREKSKKSRSINSKRNSDNDEPIEVPIKNKNNCGQMPEVIILEELRGLMNIPMDPPFVRPRNYDLGRKITPISPPREQEQMPQQLAASPQSHSSGNQSANSPQKHFTKDPAHQQKVNEPQAHNSKDQRFNVNHQTPSTASTKNVDQQEVPRPKPTSRPTMLVSLIYII
jgi:hypothetical protein